MSKNQDIRWGVVATIKAPARDILEFAAYHLDLGASRVTVCLDDDAPLAEAHLNAHPLCRAIRTTRDYWRETCGYVPKKHQVRQTQNATRVYRETTDLDWLCHIDVDEYLVPKTSVAETLSAITAPLAHVRPCESLCVEPNMGLDPAITYCKALTPSGTCKREIEADLYPNYGGYFQDGFVSHRAGKNFLRIGRANVNFNIHRAFDVDEAGERTSIEPHRITDIELCHRHIESWDKWLKIMAFRLEKGSYRQELDANVDPLLGRVGKHTLFTHLQEDGDTGLRAFFEEVCLATPRLLDRLEAHGLLRRYSLGLSQKIEKHFPDFAL